MYITYLEKLTLHASNAIDSSGIEFPYHYLKIQIQIQWYCV